MAYLLQKDRKLSSDVSVHFRPRHIFPYTYMLYRQPCFGRVWWWYIQPGYIIDIILRFLMVDYKLFISD